MEEAHGNPAAALTAACALFSSFFPVRCGRWAALGGTRARERRDTAQGPLHVVYSPTHLCFDAPRWSKIHFQPNSPFMKPLNPMLGGSNLTKPAVGIGLTGCCRRGGDPDPPILAGDAFWQFIQRGLVVGELSGFHTRGQYLLSVSASNSQPLQHLHL